MSKKKVRQSKKSSALRRSKRSPRQVIVLLCLLLVLSLVGGIFAQWRAKHMHAMLSPAPAPTAPGSPSKEYIYAGGRLIATEEPAATAASAAPTDFHATALPTQTTSPVHLTWTAPPGSFDHYRVESKLHKSDPQWTAVNTNLANTASSYDDTAAAANTAYLYRICAVTGSQSSCTPPDLATTTYMQDSPFQATHTTIRAQHFLDLMSAVNAVRVLAEMPAITWSINHPAPAVGGTIYASHLNDLRDGLSPALTALNLGTPQYESPVPMSSYQVNASQLQQLQDLVK
jgi:hypothetical protein